MTICIKSGLIVPQILCIGRRYILTIAIFHLFLTLVFRIQNNSQNSVIFMYFFIQCLICILCGFCRRQTNRTIQLQVSGHRLGWVLLYKVLPWRWSVVTMAMICCCHTDDLLFTILWFSGPRSTKNLKSIHKRNSMLSEWSYDCDLS